MWDIWDNLDYSIKLNSKFQLYNQVIEFTFWVLNWNYLVYLYAVLLEYVKEIKIPHNYKLNLLDL